MSVLGLVIVAGCVIRFILFVFVVKVGFIENRMIATESPACLVPSNTLLQQNESAGIDVCALINQFTIINKLPRAM